MINQGGIWAQWKPQQSISGAAVGGKVWVESFSSQKQTAIVQIRNASGFPRRMVAKLADLTRA